MKEEIKEIIDTYSIFKLIKPQFLEKEYNSIFLKISVFKERYYKNDILPYSQIVYLYNHNIISIPKCYCGNQCTFKSFSEGYRGYCSNKCSANSKNKQEKIEKTCTERYGVKNVAQKQEVKDKKRETFLANEKNMIKNKKTFI